MKIKSFGCSFIFGTDMPDDGRNALFATSSRLTWPALIAEHHGYQYETRARPGSGNLQILERLLNHVRRDDPAIYIIGWTYIDRFDYIDPELATPWPGTKWRTLMPIDRTELADTYFRHLNAEYSDILRSLIYIKTAIDCLRHNACRFIMTYMDPLIVDSVTPPTSSVSILRDYVRPYLSDFQGQTFLQWSQANKFAISDTMHPLQDAHRAAADMILSEWDQRLKS